MNWQVDRRGRFESFDLFHRTLLRRNTRATDGVRKFQDSLLYIATAQESVRCNPRPEIFKNNFEDTAH